jgi:hypothetical protein
MLIRKYLADLRSSGDLAPENVQLSLRDSLLLKLVRGEVRVKDVEKEL